MKNRLFFISRISRKMRHVEKKKQQKVTPDYKTHQFKNVFHKSPRPDRSDQHINIQLHNGINSISGGLNRINEHKSVSLTSKIRAISGRLNSFPSPSHALLFSNPKRSFHCCITVFSCILLPAVSNLQQDFWTLYLSSFTFSLLLLLKRHIL